MKTIYVTDIVLLLYKVYFDLYANEIYANVTYFCHKICFGKIFVRSKLICVAQSKI